ncbi:DUF4913 domain-containing protein [Brevibacterium litoralis]|uniref:DUF4913 domain-containing protein n=1 Tax=Brevibacterium litoralis TaxID=3138935 RepID=UPI0032ED5A59
MYGGNPTDSVAYVNWWEYSEVVQRIEALWLSWEKMRLEGGPGLVAFFRDYLDPMMNVILSKDGPFARYSPGRVQQDRLPQLPSAPPPPGLFDFPQ